MSCALFCFSRHHPRKTSPGAASAIRVASCEPWRPQRRCDRNVLTFLDGTNFTFTFLILFTA